jgi:hypothetical protein
MTLEWCMGSLDSAEQTLKAPREHCPRRYRGDLGSERQDQGMVFLSRRMT